MKTLGAQTGAEGVGAFHAALIADFLNKPQDAEAGYQKALSLNPASPRVIEAYGNFLERQGRAADAAALLQQAETNPPHWRRWFRPGWRRSRRAKSPSR